MSVRVVSTLRSGWIPATEKKLDRAALEIATDIDRFAKILAPKDTGNLVNSGKITRNKSGSYTISFGGGAVRYARMRHYHNLLHPGTLKYLERAGDSVSKGNIKKYIK